LVTIKKVSNYVMIQKVLDNQRLQHSFVKRWISLITNIVSKKMQQF